MLIYNNANHLSVIGQRSTITRMFMDFAFFGERQYQNGAVSEFSLRYAP